MSEDRSIFREPLVASLGDIGKNNLNMMKFGWNGTMSAPAWKSVGGATSGLARAGIGAGVGAAVGSMTGTQEGTAAGAVIGGAAGWAAPAAVGAAARGVWEASGVVGQFGADIGKSMLGMPASGAGGAMGAGAAAVTNGAKSLGLGAMTAGAGIIANSPLLNGILNPGNVMKDSAGASKFRDLKFSGIGKAYIGVGIAAGAANQAWDAEKKIKMGQIDPYIKRAAPKVPDFANNGGATGDLVFAMHQNRRG
jgi:hypothetical protein